MRQTAATVRAWAIEATRKANRLNALADALDRQEAADAAFNVANRAFLDAPEDEAKKAALFATNRASLDAQAFVARLRRGK